ncbi:hypothetical protein ACFL6S_29880 [Candidatus Poribacteria bacterium]
MFSIKQDNESGMVLLVALVVTLLSTILASSFMSITIYESRHSVWQKHKAQSLLLAEAGVEKSLYYLNNLEDPENPWADQDGEVLTTPLEYAASLANGQYDATLYGQVDMPWLPPNSYLVRSGGTIPRTNSGDIDYGVSCIVRRLPGIPIPAALTIFDEADPEIELNQFDSVGWTVDGKDIDDPFGGGLPGIAIANRALSMPGTVEGDDLLAQLGDRVEQVEGIDSMGDPATGVDAIIEDPSLPKNLDAYANYFEKIAIDISGVGNIPREALGSYDEPQVLYADLNEGPIRLLPNQPGYGVLVLDGIGDFRLDDVSMEGRAEWYGVIICARDSQINLHGGGNSPSHIYGALLVANGQATMNGTADIVYSSDHVNNVNAKLLLYQVYSWCGSWGSPLGSDGYNPVCEYNETADMGI